MRIILCVIILAGCAQIGMEEQTEKNQMCLEGIRSWGYKPACKTWENVLIINVIIADSPDGSDGSSNLHGDTIFVYRPNQETFNHELGHALGVPHIKDPNDLMYPYENGAIYPSALDILIAHSVTDPDKKIRCQFN